MKLKVKYYLWLAYLNLSLIHSKRKVKYMNISTASTLVMVIDRESIDIVIK